MSISRTLAAISLSALSALGLATSAAALTIEPVAEGLEGPWGVAPLPTGGLLVTEKAGRLIYQKDGARHSVDGLPEVAVVGQGGLLDITLARDFEQSRMLYLTYAKRQEGGGAGTALASARLSEDAKQLEDVTELFAMKPGSSGGQHFGSRVVEAPDGTLLMTIGERGDRPAAQDRSTHNGSIIRVNRDGSVPDDNPFVDEPDVLPEIWSYGHRNPQGAGLDLEGRLWVSEHGAKGGDEVNRISKGANYGWPVISFGEHYSGEKIGEGTAKEGMEQPALYWDPSIAPAGLMVYSGAQFPEWEGNIFVGSLKFDYIARLSGDPLEEVQQIKTAETARVRDVVEGPDGAIWFISEINGTVYRITP
ncbi:PQQ-dependent sugar dehydrogenase [Sulfitobacter delicatus]|uniref:Glucose/arabinose dehydrogenase, beta-propeller fold n=1 Tax=Sulfitobacter delicatus TaxID=218672 RepID=A0A1G7QXI9_9RHOB|nr:PQQ-dependent sugar dehydrogenase [Sulfitobacter delicatus]SDG03235.1 Glucose/arabinose dehydrogenase, beta-propeller fold [Sulfitobacter delicatus]